MSHKLTRRKMLQLSGAAASVLSICPDILAFDPSASSATAAASGNGSLLKDDFSGLRSGWLTFPFATQGPAIQENQWINERAHPFGVWFNGVANQDAWMVATESETEKPYMMMLLSHPQSGAYAALVAGEPEWKDYTVEVDVRPLAFDGVSGIGFRYQHNRCYYLFGFSAGKQAVLALQNPYNTKFRDTEWTTVETAEFTYSPEQYYRLKVENEGDCIRCFIDGKKVLETFGAKLKGGRVALAANVPVRYQNVEVYATPEKATAITAAVSSRLAEEAKLQAENPKPKLWRKFSVKGFSAASNCRFGDLDGDGEIEMLIVQNIQTIRGDGFDGISCMTAVKQDGTILWQKGRPDARNVLLTNDNPVQIHDIDGDGHPEVICIRDFQLQILDGRTGAIKKKAWMPKAPKPSRDSVMQGTMPYDRVFGDSLFMVNASGDKRRHDILFKDRYWNFWVYNNNLEFLWKGEGQTGHTPFPFDVNGYDRIAIGYALWDHTGKLLWSLDRELVDHADAIAVTDMTDTGAMPRFYYMGSDEGYISIDIDGKMLKHLRIGHAQSCSVGKYRMDLPGRQLATVNFHCNVGIMYMFDAEGNVLESAEIIHNGSKMLPVNWRGDGQELILLSTDPKYGGMVDGHFRRAVMFPDDGHPDLAYFVLDLDNDGLDEIVTWDENSAWIYKADAPAKGGKLYTPERNPLYNWSNYMAVVSRPKWKNA